MTRVKHILRNRNRSQGQEKKIEHHSIEAKLHLKIEDRAYRANAGWDDTSVYCAVRGLLTSLTMEAGLECFR
jgi:hypothetical protein